MADFETAIEVVLKNEGGLVDDPQDSGGITNFGISLNFYKTIDDKANAEDIKNLTVEMAKEIYLKSFWLPNKYALIDCQAVATKLLDMAVDMGAPEANMCLQRALYCLSLKEALIDGIIGSDTITAVNHYIDMIIYHTLKSECANHYRIVIAEHPHDAKFLAGWLKRAYSDVL